MIQVLLHLDAEPPRVRAIHLCGAAEMIASTHLMAECALPQGVKQAHRVARYIAGAGYGEPEAHNTV